MNSFWPDSALSFLNEGQHVGLATIIHTRGSAPRHSGARLIVTGTATYGTIGGGRLEQISIDQLQKLIKTRDKTWRVQSYPLGPFLGQCCGGRVLLLLERLGAADVGWLKRLSLCMKTGEEAFLQHRFSEMSVERIFLPFVSDADHQHVAAIPLLGSLWNERLTTLPRVVIAGAGHVGQALICALRQVNLRLDWLDVRSSFSHHGATIVDSAKLVSLFGSAFPGDILFIMTHDHALDFSLVAAALGGQAQFIGLIGSQSKRASFISRLARLGLDDEAVKRLVCPIGLNGIRHEEPGAIAISVAAQILSLLSSRNVETARNLSI
jgi:xanthine dehydrogenase accessory factor